MVSSMQVFRRIIEQQQQQRLRDFLANHEAKAKEQSLQKLRQLYADAKRELHQDRDGDGITDLEERYRGTNPYSVDTDWDGYTDLEELALDCNPSSSDSHKKKMAQQAQSSLSEDLEL